MNNSANGSRMHAYADDFMKSSNEVIQNYDANNGLSLVPIQCGESEMDIGKNLRSCSPSIDEILQWDQSKYANSMLTSHKVIPAQRKMFLDMHFPLSWIVQPWEDVRKTRLVKSVTRCKNCGCYLNPFVQLSLNSTSWECPICFESVDISPEAHSRLELDGLQRGDKGNQGVHWDSYETIATEDFISRVPQRKSVVFVVEKSADMGPFNAIERIHEGLKCILSEADSEYPRVALVTYGDDVRVYDLQLGIQQKLSDASSISIALNDKNTSEPTIFVGFPSPTDHYLSNLSKGNFFVALQSTSRPAACVRGESASKALLVALKIIEASGGKVLHFSTLRASNSCVESDVVKFDSKFLSDTAKYCSAHNITISSIYFTTPSLKVEKDVFKLSFYSGGEVFQISNETTSIEVCAIFSSVLSTKCAIDGILRLRATKGLSISDVYGSGSAISSDLHVINTCGPHKSLLFLLKYDVESLNVSKNVILQAAFLYTNARRERRIRVQTISLSVSHGHEHVYASLNPVALACTWARVAAYGSLIGLSNTMLRALDSLGNAVAYLNKAYCIPSYSSASHTLQIPEALAIYPILLCTIYNNSAFSGQNSQSTIEIYRLVELVRILTLDVDSFMALIYPMFIHPIKGLLPLSSSKVNAETENSLILRFQSTQCLIKVSQINDLAMTNRDTESLHAMMQWLNDEKPSFLMYDKEMKVLENVISAQQLIPKDLWVLDPGSKTMNLSALVQYVTTRAAKVTST